MEIPDLALGTIQARPTVGAGDREKPFEEVGSDAATDRSELAQVGAESVAHGRASLPNRDIDAGRLIRHAKLEKDTTSHTSLCDQ